MNCQVTGGGIPDGDDKGELEGEGAVWGAIRMTAEKHKSTATIPFLGVPREDGRIHYPV